MSQGRCTCISLEAASPFYWDQFLKHARTCALCYNAQVASDRRGRECADGQLILQGSYAIAREARDECEVHEPDEAAARAAGLLA